MKSSTLRWLAATCTACFASSGTQRPAEAAEQQLAHMVYFQLQDRSEETREKLVAGCKKYLTGHDGVIYFSVGARVADLDRDVNDTQFDVSLHVVFRDRAAHDRYQVQPRHLKFIEEHKGLWKSARVCDSYLTP